MGKIMISTLISVTRTCMASALTVTMSLTSELLLAEEQKRCLIVASYHNDFPGQKLKVDGARDLLKNHCHIKQFDMDTKRHPDEVFGKQKALEAKELINTWKPDVVLAIDDNASRYLVKPHFKDSSVPFVFSGVDWTVKEYGYPYSNATGMIEVMPFMHMAKHIKRINPETKRGIFIRPDRYSAVKVFNHANTIYRQHGIELIDAVITTIDEFERVYLEAQSYDFIHFTNNAAIEGWNDERVEQFVLQNTQTLVVSSSSWLLNYSMLTFTQDISEQGSYAAEIAIKILQGHNPSDFPIVPNRKWNIYINKKLIEKSKIRLPEDLLRKANKV